MFFNIKFALSDNTSGDIDLFGLKVSVFSNSTYAAKGPGKCEDICTDDPRHLCTYLIGTGFCFGYFN